jgi:exosortase/archaeosortase family protein
MAAQLFRIEFSASGPVVSLAGANLEIITDCTPVMPLLVLWSAIFAFPARPGWKLGGILAGGTALWAYNIARVLALAFVLKLRPQWFDFVHVYLWQTFTILIVLAMFAGWLRLLQAKEASA